MTVGATEHLGMIIVKDEAPSVSDWAVTYWNWIRVDALLYQTAIGHKHNGEASIADPTGTLGLTTIDSGGTVGSGTRYFCVTYVDANGLETAKSTSVSSVIVGTAKPTTPVLGAIEAQTDGLLANTYYYRIAYRKGSGETLPSDPITAVVSGTTAKKVTFSFDAIDDLAFAVDSIVVYRRTGTTGSYVQLSVITATTRDYYTDDNTGVPVCDKSTQVSNTFDSYNSIVIDWSSLDFSNAESVRIYTSAVDTWTGPILFIAEVDMNIATPVTSYTWTGDILVGKPPAITQCLSNPSKIDLTTEVDGRLPWANLPEDLTWKAPVDTFGDLPASPSEGEVRVVIDEASLYIWDSTIATPAWQKVLGGIPIYPYDYPDAVDIEPGELFVWKNPYDETFYRIFIGSNSTYSQDELITANFLNDHTGYYGYWEEGDDEYVPDYSYGATRFNFTTKEFEYFDDTIATPAWFPVSSIIPSYTYEEEPVYSIASVYTQEDEYGEYRLHVGQDGYYTTILDDSNAAMNVQYYGRWESGEGEFVPAGGQGSVRLNWDTKKLEYWDDSIATPAWVEIT